MLAAWFLSVPLAVAPRSVTATEVVPVPVDPGPTGTDAVGSDEAPLPAPPPAPGGRLTRGVFTGRGWFELGVALVRTVGLPGDRRLLSAGLAGAFGLRPHRNFGVLTGATTWIGDVQEREGVDEDGNAVVLSASVATTAWDVVGVRAFLPIGKRLEPSVDLGSGVVFERRPFTGRRVWGGLHAALGLAVWVSPTLSLRFAADYRLAARTDARRQFVGGTAMFSAHF
jgi:hypothetical protein